MAAPCCQNFNMLKGLMVHPGLRHLANTQVGIVFRPKPTHLGVQLNAVRHKGSKRFKQPPGAKEKLWVPKALRSAPKNEIVEQISPAILGRVPVDDVWMRNFYPPPHYSVAESITMHRELASPEMENRPDALVVLECSLDFRTKKKTKFMAGIRNTVQLPYDFDDGIQNRVLAICKTKEEKMIATNAGAVFAGGLDLIKMIEKGEIHREEYDHVVCTVDMLPEIGQIRKVLRDDIPNRVRGNLGGDIEKMVQHFTKGKTYISTKKSDAVGLLSVNIGRLNMPMDELQANYDAYVEIIGKSRSADLGPFILEAHICCPPSVEKFQIITKETLPLEQRHLAIKELEQEEEEVIEEEEAEEEEQEQKKARAK